MEETNGKIAMLLVNVF